MNIVVLDTSALIRLYIPDGPQPDKLEDCIVSAWKGETILLVPELAWAELTQVLLKKEQAGLISQTEVDEILSAIMELPLETVRHREIMKHALHIARKNTITIYDALFFALADLKKAELITADLTLQKMYLRHVV